MAAARIMRLVTHGGLPNELRENTYTANETTRLINQQGFSGGEKHQYVLPLLYPLHRERLVLVSCSFDLCFPIAARLVEQMHKTGVYQFLANDKELSLFRYGHNGMHFFEYFDKTAEQRKYMDDYMAVRRVGLATWFETFPHKPTRIQCCCGR